MGYSTITAEQVRVLAGALAWGGTPVIDGFEPVADFEELGTFAAENPTPVFSGDRDPVWRVESVAARLVEAFAIAAHERLSGADWEILAGIVAEHAEYLYTFHHSPQKRHRMNGGAALALAGGVCRLIPQAAAWRLAGFARIAEAAESTSPSYLVELVDAAFEIAAALHLPILEEGIEVYNTVLNRDFRWEKLERLRLTDAEFFDRLDLDREGLEAVKSELTAGDVERGKLAYEAFLRRRRINSELSRASDERDDSVGTQPASIAKSRLERARRLSTQTGLSVDDVTGRAVAETSDIGVAAALYPEWRDSEQLLALALRRCSWILHTRFFPDGCHVHGSTRSQYDVFIQLWRFYHLGKLGGVQFSPDFDAQMERILEAFTYLSQPDYCLPASDDGDRSEASAAEVCSLGIKIFDRDDLRYIASEGMEGEPPKETSHAFPYAGYYVMRDCWRPEAQYLLFDAGNVGAGGRPLGDKLSFLLYAYGRRLIAAPGMGVSGSEEYSRSSRAHNSIVIDGKGQRSGPTDEAAHVPDADTRWISTPSFDFAEGWYKDGYGDDGDDAVVRDLVHKRSIFNVRGEYFILHDLVLGESEHRIEQVFHMAPGNVERLEGGIVRTAEAHSGNLVIAPADADGLEVTLGGGGTSPRELVYAMDLLLPTAMNLVLFPLAPHEEVSPEIRLMEVGADADVLATGFSVAHGGFTDLVLISDDGFAEMRTSELEFRGEYAVLRLDGEGQPLWWRLVHGEFLSWRGEVLESKSSDQWPMTSGQ